MGSHDDLLVFFTVLGLTVFATSAFFVLIASGFLPFYLAFLQAWSALPLSLSPAGLVAGSANNSLLRADSLSCKSCHQLVLSVFETGNPSSLDKFRVDFGNLDWAAAWKALFFMPLDRKAIDLCWKVAYGVLYTADRLIHFGDLDVSLSCFCGHPVETSEHLFFSLSFSAEWPGLDSVSFCFCPLH